MHAIEAFLGRPEVERLGWVLLHFLWQGTIGAAFLAIVLFVLRRASANARYLAACATLVAMAACLPATWLVVPHRSPPARPAMAAMEPANPQPMVVAHEPVTARDSGTFIGAPDKPLDELFAKDRHQQPPEINIQAAVAAAPGMTWQQRIAVGLPWFATIWLGGVMALSLRLAIGWSAVRRLRRAASQSADDSRQAVLSRLSRQLGIRWSVKLLESALVEVPTMIGWLRPAILWPPSVLAGLSVEQFESLLAHELAHVRRHDYLVNLAQTAIETLLFYHPAVWWVSNRIRQERECCCDDLAVATCGNRISYARALTALEELRPRPRQFALAADGGRLLLRIRRIVGLPAPRRSGSRHWLLGIALSGTALALIAALGLSNFATGDEPAKKSTDSQPSVKPAEQVTAAELLKIRETRHHLPFDLIVQKLGNSDADDLLPEELGDRIKQIPHLTSVTPVLDVSLHEFGLPPDSAEFKGLNILSGRLPTAGDRHKVVVGKVLADKLGYKVGDTIKVYVNEVQVIGIFESPLDPLNDSVQMPLADMQEFMHAEHRATEFLVRIDTPLDKLREPQARMTELRKRIEALGDAVHCEITAIEANPSEKPPEKSKMRDERPSQPSLELDGRVVDDETGKPLAAFHRQIGRIEQNGVTWGFSEITGPPVADGYFKAFLNWEAGERIRIVAGGYVPQLVLTEQPKAGAKTIERIVVRMKRGRQISGRVLDDAGKPVAGASVFVVGAFGGVSQIKVGGGKAMMADRDGGWTEDDSVTRFATDAEGKFTVSGIGWDAKYIAVSCPALDLWIVPAPTASEPQNGFDIRLPQAGKLILHYDIAGAPDETDIAVWPSVDNLPYGGGRGPMGPGLYLRRDQQGRPLGNMAEVLYGHNVVIRQHGELVFDNLPPGEYTVARTKHTGFRFDDTMVALGRRVVKVISGRTTVVDFVMNQGATVIGQVVGLDRDDVHKADPYAVFVTVQTARDEDDSIKSMIDEVVMPATDKDGKPADGKFASERLLPGQYRVRSRVYDYDNWEKSRYGWRQRQPNENFPPAYVGETLVTVPENGDPPPVKIELHKFEKSATKPAPAKAAAPAPAKQGAGTPAKAQPNAALLTRVISGHAVDAETGQPVQDFVYDEATFDEHDPARFHWNGDAIGPGSQRDGEFGIVVKNQPGRPIWARIVAPGYVPQPITEKPIVLGDDAALDKLVVKMHRGKELVGRVVDSAGKPVADAGVYLLRNQGRRQVVCDPAVAGPNQQYEMLAITHAATDADGRFKLTGWDAESGRVAVLSREMNLWVTAIPADTADWTIHLPHPATIECLVEDDRGERDTFYDMDFVTAGRKGWEMLRAYQFNLRSKDGRLVMANHTPGQYQLTRRRHVSVGDYEGEFHLADVKLQVNPADTFTIDLRRPVGWPIAGQVVGLKELSLSGAVISVEPPGEVKRGAMTFDALTCGEDGRFETGRIPPGKYRVHVDTYLPKKPADPRIFGGGLDLPLSARLPDFTADAEVTITKDEQPAKLKLELKKGGESRAFRELMQYHEQPHPATIDEFTAPLWTVAAPNENPAEKPKQEFRSLVVQKTGKYPELNIGLLEELGDRIKAIPHVKAVSGGLMDVVSFPEHQLAAVVISGLPPDSPLFAEWKLKAGRLPKAGDHAKVVVGMELAKNLKVNVTDTIKIYDTDVEIIGIFESKNAFENGSIATLLTDLQKFMDRPKQVTGFLVRTDVSREDPPENRALIAEVRKRIEALGEGIAASEKPSEIHRAMSKSYERTRFGDQAKSPLTLVAASVEAPMPESKPIDVRGQVIDDATGKPIALFDIQGGHVDPKDATKITWGYYLRPNAGGVEGRFDANIDWNAGWRARIIASAYVPQPILTEPPKAGQTKIDGLVLRMKRGREVSGRVLDHAGKPVKDASLFVVGSRPMDITGGKALMNSSHGLVEDSSAVRYSTDADGRFTLAGIGEDAKNIAVSCPAVDLWILPAPSADEAAKGFEIRLPEPGKLIVHYDIPGGAEEATIFLQLHTWDREGWQGVDNRRRPTVKQHGELVLDNMPPGLYEVVRDTDGFLDRRQVTIEPGKTVTTDFIRKTGAPITGRVVGLDREDVQKAKPTSLSVSVYKPGDERNPLAPKFASLGIDPFDKEGKPSDGSFKTEIIPPGEYLVRASVFIKERPERGYRTGTIPPGFEGEATVTVPEQGAPPPVEIQLKKWGYKAPENPQPKKDAVDKSKQDAVDAAVKRGIGFLARQQAERDAAAKAVPNEVTITIDPALAAELRALDAMRAGASTPFEKVDEMGEKLLDRFHEPDERGQIYYALLQVHGQSGLVTPEHIIEYAKKALDYRLGSRQELMVYIYWGDALNVRKTEKPWREQRIEAAEIYLRGLRRLWQYNVPEQPPELPDPPPVYNGDDGTERDVAVAAMKHYMELKNKSDFIKELIYHRQIFIRQVADMYHRRGATPTEIEELRRLASDMLANESAVARLMAAVSGEDAKAEKLRAEIDQLKVPEEDIEAAISKDSRIQQAMIDLSQLTRELHEAEKAIKNKDDPAAVRYRDAINSVRQNIEEIKNEDRQQVIDQIRRNGGLTNPAPWSEPVGGIVARLSIERAREVNGTPIIATYLELRNVSDSAAPIEIALDPSKIEFKVTDSKGKEVAQAGLPYDGITASPGPLRLPHDSQLRLGVSGNGAGIPKDQGALLDLAPSAVWLFQRGDTGEYNLHAKFTVAKTDDHLWHGTIEVPPARIPLAK